MRIFNVIMIHDMYVVAESNTDAVEAVRAFITEQAGTGDVKPTEQTALESRSANNIRESWRKERPLVGPGVSDADFETLKGKTTSEIWDMIYSKPNATLDTKKTGASK